MLTRRNYTWDPGPLSRPKPADKDASRRIRVGYLSPDFRQHPVAFFIENFLRYHRRSEFHVTCFACSPAEDSYTELLRQLSDEWETLAGMSTEEAAKRIREKEIDIAVDLAGHHVQRSGKDVAPVDVLARFAAPVQVTWIGYPNTTGLDCVQYRLTDNIADPPESSQKYSEELVRLDTCFLCIAPPQDLLCTEVGKLPQESNGHVTFASFNDLSKISPSTARLWGRLLLAMPDARLKIKVKDAGKYSINHDNFGQFADRFVSIALDPAAPGFNFKSKAKLRQRIDIMPANATLKEHFANFHYADIALDPFPYSGTTTSVDALLMGVPVVTLRTLGALVCPPFSADACAPISACVIFEGARSCKRV